MDEVISSAAPEEGAGVEEQGVAAPAAYGGEDRKVAETGAKEGKESKQQSAEERHRQAEARRKAERESYKAQLRQELEAENAKKMDSIIASMGRVNPFTKKPINTMAELEEYNRENDKRKKAERLSKLGISQEDFDELVENHPTVKAAKEAAAALQQQKAELIRAQQDEELRAEMAEISKIDPNIKTPTDLMNHPMYAEVKRLVQENDHSIAEAFRIATEPARAKEQNDRVRQSAALAASGKSHLSSMQAAGGTAPQITVPEAVMKGYRLSNPKITPEQARKQYARYLALKRI